MRVLHLVLVTVATYALIVAVQVFDRRRLQPEVRERAWNFASWGAAVYWLSGLSLLGWGWVTRSRFDDFLGRRLTPTADGEAGALHRILRAVLGLGVGVLELVVVAVVLEGVEYVFSDVLGLPPYSRLR